MLNQFGFPKKWDSEDQRVAALVQGEAHAIYSSMLQWTSSSPIWLVGGDLNETRLPIDRSNNSEQMKKKFVDNFLEDSNGKDIWRSLFPDKPGFTFRLEQKKKRKSRKRPKKKDKKESENEGKKGKSETEKSFSRLDYFLASPSIPLNGCTMSVDTGNRLRTIAGYQFHLYSLRHSHNQAIKNGPFPNLNSVTLVRIRNYCANKVLTLY